GAAVHLGVPPRGRAGDCDGMPPVPRRRGPHPHAPAQDRAGGYLRAGDLCAGVRGGHCAAAVWTVKMENQEWTMENKAAALCGFPSPIFCSPYNLDRMDLNQ